jgi:hypothetical protein
MILWRPCGPGGTDLGRLGGGRIPERNHGSIARPEPLGHPTARFDIACTLAHRLLQTHERKISRTDNQHPWLHTRLGHYPEIRHPI